MCEIINKFLYLRQPGFTYSSCGPCLMYLTYNEDRLVVTEKFIRILKSNI